MNFTSLVPKALTRSAGRASVRLQKNSPGILFYAGLAGTVTSTVLACRATLKLHDTLDEIREEVDGVTNGGFDRKDHAYVYAKSAARLGRLYAPAAFVGGLSLVALTKSHRQLTQRNIALSAAYAALANGYEAYRERVREELGEEKEAELYRGITEETTTVDGKKIKVATVDPNKMSPYARFFDEFSVNWVKDPELNRLFVECQQRYANQLLLARGHVFLNEVYDSLGIERSSAGSIVGWVLDAENSDNYIDFGMYEPKNRHFVNGNERSILLDFNVDGVIFDKI